MKNKRIQEYEIKIRKRKETHDKIQKLKGLKGLQKVFDTPKKSSFF